MLLYVSNGRGRLDLCNSDIDHTTSGGRFGENSGTRQGFGGGGTVIVSGTN